MHEHVYSRMRRLSITVIGDPRGAHAIRWQRRARTEARQLAFPRVGYIRRAANVRRPYEPM